MDEKLGRGEGVAWLWDLLARLPEEVEPGAILPLQALDANLMHWHPGPPDAPVCGPHQSDGNRTLDVYTRPWVGLPPLYCDLTGYTF